MKRPAEFRGRARKSIGLARGLPRPLLEIEDQVCIFEAHGDEGTETARHQALQAERLGRVTAQVRVEDDRETIRMGDLSPGCRACKAGKWDCLFFTMECNLSCSFCLTPGGLGNASALSALGDEEDGLCDAYSRCGIEGIGFSGGEPLLVPHRVLHCLSEFRARLPDLYFWAYTNGLSLTKDLISALAEAGLHELRFNMAATGYRHPWTTSMLRYAVTCVPSVAVEIPAIPEDGELLRGALPAWSQMGVKHLNLHDLVYETGSPSDSMPGARVRCRLPDGHACEVNPESSELVADVLRDVEAGGLSIAVNYCSLGNKVRQLRGRRRMLADSTLRPWEHHCKEDAAESVCYFNETHCEFAHPETLADETRRPPGLGVALVRRLLPLTAEGPGQWTHFELLQGLQRS